MKPTIEDVEKFCDGSCLDHPENENYCMKDCDYKRIWKGRRSEKMKSKWTATYVELIGNDLNEVRSFGNVGGFIYENGALAWDACIKDFEETKKTYPDSHSYVNSENRHIELWDEDEGVKFVWEIQKVKDYDEANGIDAPSWNDSVEEACEKYEEEKKSVDWDSINLELDNLQKFIDKKISEIKKK